MKTLSSWIIALLLLVTGSALLADQVTPNDRVETRLRVRQQPDGGSTVIAFLEPGQTAELDGDVPYWYRIKLSGGTLGFVSKGFSRVIPAVGPAQVLRLGSWNLKKLGHGSSKDFALVAKIIDDNFDVLAIVEVMQKQGGHPGYDSLMTTLGSTWAGLVTSQPRPNNASDGNAEFYAIVYRTARARPCAGWTALIYHADNDGSGNSTAPDLFSREPAFGCFVAGNFDFLLAAYHATWSGGDIEDISAEVRHVDEVFASMAAARPGEGDLLIGGDFNLVSSDLAAATGLEISTVGSGSTLNGSGERTANLYDHLLVHDRQNTAELIGAEEVIDVRGEAADNKTFFRTVSDHLPIVARFNTATADDD